MDMGEWIKDSVTTMYILYFSKAWKRGPKLCEIIHGRPFIGIETWSTVVWKLYLTKGRSRVVHRELISFLGFDIIFSRSALARKRTRAFSEMQSFCPIQTCLSLQTTWSSLSQWTEFHRYLHWKPLNVITGQCYQPLYVFTFQGPIN